MKPGIIRILDANCNRVSEGLRVLEDISRFILNDSYISFQLKSIRHLIIGTMKNLGIQLVNQRNISADIGSLSREDSKKPDLYSMVSANAKRVEEGLRVIEETAKLNDFKDLLNYYDFKKTRFSVYQIERSISSKILRQEKTSRISGLYVILDPTLLGNRDIELVCNQTIKGGATIIQLRDKTGEKRQIFETAFKLQNICAKHKVIFIVNDYLDIALGCNADGIHVGQTDLPVEVVRRLLPIDKIIGFSANTLSQAKKAQKEGADYVAVGSIFSTTTKGDISIVGIDRLRRIKNSLNSPVVAIGGINKNNLKQVLASGADAVAVISAVLQEADIEKSTSKLVDLIKRKRE